MTSLASDHVGDFDGLYECLSKADIYVGLNMSGYHLEQLISHDEEYQLAVRHDNVFLTLYYIYAVVILLGNGFVVCLVVKKKILQTVTSLYVTSLCLTGK